MMMSVDRLVLDGAPPPHGGEGVVLRGDPSAASRVVVAVHGRGGSAEGMLSLAGEIEGGDGFAWAAPRARGQTWYPYSFLAPTERNEPGLSSGLGVLEALVGELEGRGIPPERVVLLGFSQGACLALEYALRHPRRWGGLVGLSGGWIGPPGTVREEVRPAEEVSGDFAGTPVFLGCADPDPHIPRQRVEETAAWLEARGARVTKRIYPGGGHGVNRDEVEAVGRLLAEVRVG